MRIPVHESRLRRSSLWFLIQYKTFLMDIEGDLNDREMPLGIPHIFFTEFNSEALF